MGNFDNNYMISISVYDSTFEDNQNLVDMTIQYGGYGFGVI